MTCQTQAKWSSGNHYCDILQSIMATITHNLQQVHAQRMAACHAAQRPEQSVTLLVVTKTQSAASVRQAFAAGERQFGENYVQEGLDKISELTDLRSQLTWHLIGPLQSNKTRSVAEQFDWVHTIDRLKIAERLSAQRPPNLAPLQICLQVNISQEPRKSGLTPNEVLSAAQAVVSLPGLRLRGLMAIPAQESDANQAAQRRPFAAMALLLRTLQQQGHALDTLSMGMSADMSAAILEGATLIRVGTAIFGPRPLLIQPEDAVQATAEVQRSLGP